MHSNTFVKSLKSISVKTVGGQSVNDVLHTYSIFNFFTKGSGYTVGTTI